MAGEHVFVVAADDDYDVTVASPFEAGDEAPEAIAGDDVRVWGVDDDDVHDAMTAGDVVLFYRDGRYVGVGTVGEPFEDDEAWLAGNAWPTEGFDACFTLDDFDPVDLSRAAVHAIFDYSANYYPSTPMQIPDDRVDNSLDAIYEAVRRYAQTA